jgi:NAD(P)-dependent dehydrogenase (short-subunit alcohol dehydrogenase family)
MSRKVAFITGASRGIGKACATELAEAGFDIAITARTVAEGEAREHSSTVKASDMTPLPGSLNSTADEVRAKGAQCLSVQADLLDPASLGAAVATVLERWGGIDVVVHNGRYIGPGHMDKFMDTPMDLLRKQVEGNLFAPLIVNQLVIPQMIKRGGGTIVNISSGAGYSMPTAKAGEGGWAMGYAISKGGFHRVAGMIKVEHGDQGINCFNVNPGWVVTERIIQDMAKFNFDTSTGAAPIIPGKVVRWLCTDPEAAKYNGRLIEAQEFCEARNLMPGWKKPGIGGNADAVRDGAPVVA